jgi:hypothetical protein
MRSVNRVGWGSVCSSYSLNHIDGVTFRDAWRGRLVAQFDEHQVGFPGLEQLRTKLAAARAKDLADVAIMNEMADATRRPGRRRSVLPGKKISSATW